MQAWHRARWQLSRASDVRSTRGRRLLLGLVLGMVLGMVLVRELVVVLMLRGLAGQAGCSRVGAGLEPGQPSCEVVVGQGPGPQASLSCLCALGPAGRASRPVPIGTQVPVLLVRVLLRLMTLRRLKTLRCLVSMPGLLGSLQAGLSRGCWLGGWRGGRGSCSAVPRLQADAGGAQVLAQVLQLPAEAEAEQAGGGRLGGRSCWGCRRLLASWGGWPAAEVHGGPPMAVGVCRWHGACHAHTFLTGCGSQQHGEAGWWRV